MATRVDSRLLNFEDWTLRMRPATDKPGRVLLMLHGWTGDEDSMWVFVRNMPPEYWMLAPRAPYPAPSNGYSWRSDTTIPHTLDEFRPAAEKLCDLVDRWAISAGVNASQIDVVGFSQGAAMTYVFGMLYPDRIRRLAGLAGFVPRGSDLRLTSRPLEGKSVFVAHGRQDTLVPFERARETVAQLEQAGAQVTFCEADVGHKVSVECMRSLESFLVSEET